jgi:hypothetical protein
MEYNSNEQKSLKTEELEDYWQTQAILVMKNLDINDRNNNIFPIKYSIKGKMTNSNVVNNFELMEDISI